MLEGETLANLANDHKFAKVFSAKILCLILNNIINVQIREVCFTKCVFVVNSPPKLAPTKVSLYTVTNNYCISSGSVPSHLS